SHPPDREAHRARGSKDARPCAAKHRVAPTLPGSRQLPRGRSADEAVDPQGYLMDFLSLIVGSAAGAAGASLLRSLREDNQGSGTGLADKVSWRALVDERGEEGDARQAFVELKDGALMAGWRYRGPDLDADTEEGLELLSQRVNFALLPFIDSWMFHVDAVHRPAGGYAPPGSFPDPVTRAIDEERR